MNKKHEFSLPVIGAGSLLVIYTVLCLTVFSLLSLSTALADKRLGEASVNAISQYYEADTKAEEIYAEIRSGKTPENVNISNNVYSYSCYVSETQTLEVDIEKTETGWQILRWQTVSHNEWEEETMDIWNGEGIF